MCAQSIMRKLELQKIHQFLHHVTPSVVIGITRIWPTLDSPCTSPCYGSKVPKPHVLLPYT